MEKTIIQSIQNVLPNLSFILDDKEKTFFSMDYDRKGDVIYIALDADRHADSTDPYNDDILLRKRNNMLIGVTILHASTFLQQN